MKAVLFLGGGGLNAYLLYSFFWVIPRRLNFVCQRFGTLSVPSS